MLANDCDFFNYPVYFTKTFEVLLTWYKHIDLILLETIPTVIETLLGLLIGIIFGVSIALLMAFVRPLPFGCYLF